VRGRFPSRAASGGPRHSSAGPSIAGWTGEADSRQVDRDRDDGAEVIPRSCRISTITVAVDASRADPSTPIYANAWFDWNRDGDWRDGGNRRCGPEWGLQNQVIDPASLGDDKVALVTLRFRAGRVPKQFWWRVQLHAGSPVPHSGGGGQSTPTRGGETEDWFFTRRAPTEHIDLSCTPALAPTVHGKGRVLLFYFTGATPTTRLFVREIKHELLGATGGLVSDRLEVTPDREWTVKVTSTQQHVRVPPNQMASVRVRIEALLNGRVRKFGERCFVKVMHTERVRLPFEPPGVLGGVRFSPLADPNTARCSASYVHAPDRPGGDARARCDGIGAKTLTLFAGGQNMDNWAPDPPCRALFNPNSLRCTFENPRRGKVLAAGFEVSNPFTRLTLHVLAGGRGLEGNTIVLRQDYFIRSDGTRCSQTIPRTEGQACAVLAPG
jgi:hypothetical protein